MKSVTPWNTENDGTSRTIKAQYYKNGFVNFFIGGDYGATGVFEYCGEGDSEDGIVGVLQVRGADAIDGRLRDDRNDCHRVIPINITRDRCAFAVKASYFKNAALTTLTGGGGHYPVTGVLEVDGDE